MILMPPGSAKSTYTSLLFPVWWFQRHPRSTVICASHSLGLARSFGRRARDLVQEHADQLGFAIKPTHRAADNWSTTAGGEYLAVGVRGAVVGRRADLIIIDDPVKSHAIADSKRQRDFLWDWYKSDVSTRLKPKGRVALVMTRWHKDDLGGLLEATAEDGWRVLRLPALAEPNDPLGRPPGEPLWPAWEDKDALARRRALIGERAWSALYQQRPHAPGGSLFRVARITETEASEPDAHVVRGWDFAATAKDDGAEPDWTAGVKLWRAEDRRRGIAAEDRRPGWEEGDDRVASGPGPGGQVPGVLVHRAVARVPRGVLAGEWAKGRPRPLCRHAGRGRARRDRPRPLEPRFPGGTARLPARPQGRSGRRVVPRVQHAGDHPGGGGEDGAGAFPGPVIRGACMADRSLPGARRSHEDKRAYADTPKTARSRLWVSRCSQAILV